MNIQDLFTNAENGTLTYEQFIAAAETAGAKFVDLSDGDYVSAKKYSGELATRDTRIKTLEDTIAVRDTDLKTLSDQLADAGTSAKKLGELTTQLSTLQTKYDTDMKAYEDQLKQQAYSFAVTEFANGQRFTSQAAKRDFISLMMSKNLQMEDGVIMGATDFKDAYAKDNADAFAVDTSTNEGASTPRPEFAASTQSNASSTDDGTPFVFNFTGVRPHKND